MKIPQGDHEIALVPVALTVVLSVKRYYVHRILVHARRLSHIKSLLKMQYFQLFTSSVVMS